MPISPAPGTAPSASSGKINNSYFTVLFLRRDAAMTITGCHRFYLTAPLEISSAYFCDRGKNSPAPWRHLMKYLLFIPRSV